MILLPLNAVPNQSISVTLDSNVYDIDIIQIAGQNVVVNNVVQSVNNVVMAANISRNQTVIISGARIVPAVPLLNYVYQEAGNFIFLMDGMDSYVNPQNPKDIIAINNGSAYADFQQFGLTQFLYYASTDELAAIRTYSAGVIYAGT